MSADPQGSIAIPCLRYRDAVAAIDFLCRGFGFARYLVVPNDQGGITHAQLVLGRGMVMLGSIRDNEWAQYMRQPDEAGGSTCDVYVVVADVDAHCAQARAAGAEILRPPADQDHGGRAYTCRDPEGHLWDFGSYDPWAPHAKAPAAD